MAPTRPCPFPFPLPASILAVVLAVIASPLTTADVFTNDRTTEADSITLAAGNNPNPPMISQADNSPQGMIAPNRFHGRRFTELLLYRYEGRTDGDFAFLLPDGSYHRTARPEGGIPLNDHQAHRIVQALTPENEHLRFGGAASCYNPRHAFVFMDNNGRVEIVEVCFECYRWRFTKGETPGTVDLVALAEVCAELGTYDPQKLEHLRFMFEGEDEANGDADSGD